MSVSKFVLQCIAPSRLMTHTRPDLWQVQDLKMPASHSALAAEYSQAVGAFPERAQRPLMLVRCWRTSDGKAEQRATMLAVHSTQLCGWELQAKVCVKREGSKWPTWNSHWDGMTSALTPEILTPANMQALRWASTRSRAMAAPAPAEQ